MAVVYQYSSLLTDGAQDGVGNTSVNLQNKSPIELDGAPLRVKHGSCYVSPDDISEGPNIFALARFKSSARLVNFSMGTSGVDPSDGALRWHVGVYKINTDGSIGNLVGSSASITNVTSEDALILDNGDWLRGSNSTSGVRAIWEFAGYSSDPLGDFYVCVKNVNADVNYAVTARFTIQYMNFD